MPCTIDGFALGPREIGNLQNCAGVGLLLTQLFLYSHLTKRWGLLACFVVGFAMNSLATLLFPAYGLLADAQRFPVWRYVPLACMQFFGQIGFGFCFPTIFVWINREAAASSLSLGLVNGWCQSLGSLCRALVPPAMASLLSLGLSSGLPGGSYLAIFTNGAMFMLSLRCALRAHRRLPDGPTDVARQAPLMMAEMKSKDSESPSCPQSAQGA